MESVSLLEVLNGFEKRLKKLENATQCGTQANDSMTGRRPHFTIPDRDARIKELEEELELANSLLNKSEVSNQEFREALLNRERNLASYNKEWGELLYIANMAEKKLQNELMIAQKAVDCLSEEHRREHQRRMEVENTMMGLQGELQSANAQLREIRQITGYKGKVEVLMCKGCGKWLTTLERKTHSHLSKVAKDDRETSPQD